MKVPPLLAPAQKRIATRTGVLGLCILAFYYVADFEIVLKPNPSVSWGSFSCSIKDKVNVDKAIH